jgi:hypothetical protein
MMSFSTFDNSPLPEQPYRWTRTLDCILHMGLTLTEKHHQHNMMGIGTGPAGIGKSVSLNLCQNQLAQQTPISATSIIIRVHPHATPYALTTQLLHILRRVSRAKGSSHSLNDLSEMIYQQDVSLIMLDDADRLNEACLEYLCALFDLTQCPFLLIGLPPLLLRAQKVARLFERAAINIKLPSPSFHDVLQQVLPALDFPGWSFDPTREADQILAQRLWEYASPSLRRLHNILSIASRYAYLSQEPGITHASIKYAMQQVPPPLDRTHRAEIPSDNKKKKLIHQRIHTLGHQVTDEAFDMSSIQDCFSNERDTSQGGTK